MPQPGAESPPLRRARLSIHRVQSQMTAGRSLLALICRAPSPGRSPRTLGCSDRTRREHDRLGARDTATPLLGAGSSAPAPAWRPGCPAPGGAVQGAQRQPSGDRGSWE